MEEVSRIIGFAWGYPNVKIGTAVLTLLLTGLRRGELLGLKWSDLTDDTLTINRAVFVEHNRPCVQEHLAKLLVASAQFPFCQSSLTGFMHCLKLVCMSLVLGTER